MMNEVRDQDTGRLALAIGAVAVGSAACLATYFAVGGPFGTINDIGNAATGVLSAGLAWRLRRQIPGRAGDVAVGAAVAGAALTVGRFDARRLRHDRLVPRRARVERRVRGHRGVARGPEPERAMRRPRGLGGFALSASPPVR